MTDLESDGRDVTALKELLRVAWRNLATQVVPAGGRREALKEIRHLGAELRQRFSARTLGPQHEQPYLEKPKLRLIK